jgi:hypothetical protein
MKKIVECPEIGVKLSAVMTCSSISSYLCGRCGQDVGFILALQLQPQQLRISRQVARAAEGDAHSCTSTAEASSSSGYAGKLPGGLATSI